MRTILILFILVGCSPTLFNSRNPNNEPTTTIRTTTSPRCVQILMQLSNPKKYPAIISKDMLEESGMTAGEVQVKNRQVREINYMANEADRIKVLEDVAEKQLYEAYTKKYTKRIKTIQEMRSYIKKQYGVDYKHKFGFAYNPTKNTTTFSNFGSTNVVESMNVVVYKGADPTPDNLVTSVPMRYSRIEETWNASADGDLEGMWFRYEVTFKDGAKSVYDEPLPKSFTMVDQTAPKIARSKYGTSQIYYLPDPSLRPEAPKHIPSAKIWELNIADIQPDDVDPKYWGTVDAILKSNRMMKFISHYDGIEIMPVRNAVLFENIGNNTLYLHHWGYMGKDFGFSERFGGVEGIIKLIDTMHSNGKMVYTDHVFQHSANQYKAFEWMIDDPHVADITGCGNTLNMNPGSVLEQLTMQTYKRDLFLIGFDGSRQDLAGALPKQTFINLRNTARAGNKWISGEPYGYGGGWSSMPYYDQNGNLVLRRVSDEWGPVDDAGLWDVEARDVIYKCVTDGCGFEEFKEFMSGGHVSDNYRLWKQKQSDTTMIIEVHDGTTSAQRLLSHEEALDLQYQRYAYANFIHTFSQGEKVYGPGQASALRFNHLNDNFINIVNLPPERSWVQDNFSFPMLDIHTKYRAYFAWDWTDPVNEAHRVSYLPEVHPNAGGIHYKQKPPNFEGADPSDEMLVLFNNSTDEVTFNIPDGDWKTIIDTAAVKVDSNGQMYPAAHHSYTVQPFSGVALINGK